MMTRRERKQYEMQNMWGVFLWILLFFFFPNLSSLSSTNSNLHVYLGSLTLWLNHDGVPTSSPRKMPLWLFFLGCAVRWEQSLISYSSSFRGLNSVLIMKFSLVPKFQGTLPHSRSYKPHLSSAFVPFQSTGSGTYLCLLLLRPAYLCQDLCSVAGSLFSIFLNCFFNF